MLCASGSGLLQMVQQSLTFTSEEANTRVEAPSLSAQVPIFSLNFEAEGMSNCD